MLNKQKDQDCSKSLKFDIRVNYIAIIKRRLENGEYVDGEFLSSAIRNDRSMSHIDPKVRSYIADFLEGKIEKPKGRKPEDKNQVNRRNMFIRYDYRRYLIWLQNRQKRHGQLKDCPVSDDNHFWQGPPNERAARMVAFRYLGGPRSYRRVQNIISAQKHPSI